VSPNDDAGPSFGQTPEGRKAGSHPPVISNRAVVEWNIEVAAHKDAATYHSLREQGVQ
jgi:hypothetical protein